MTVSNAGAFFICRLILTIRNWEGSLELLVRRPLSVTPGDELPMVRIVRQGSLGSTFALLADAVFAMCDVRGVSL